MTSIEPLRTTGYSPDIGWRVAWQRLSQESHYKDIPKRLQIAVGTAHRIFKRFERSGDVAPLKRSLRPDKRKPNDHHELYIINPRRACAARVTVLGHVCTEAQKGHRLPLYTTSDFHLPTSTLQPTSNFHSTRLTNCACSVAYLVATKMAGRSGCILVATKMAHIWL